MKETVLQKKLKAKMLETGISAHALEKKAGLKRSAVQNILHGRSKKPSAEILQAVAKVLGCNIYDLIGHETQTDVKISDSLPGVNLTETQYNSNLYLEAVGVANKIFKAKNIQPTNQIAFSYIQGIYSYAIETEVAVIDVRFAEWLARKQFNESLKQTGS